MHLHDYADFFANIRAQMKKSTQATAIIPAPMAIAPSLITAMPSIRRITAGIET